MGDTQDRSKLQRAMARLVAHKKAIRERREKLQEHASGMLDGAQESVSAAADGMRDDPNVLTHRYARTRMNDAARLRAIALRAEQDRAAE